MPKLTLPLGESSYESVSRPFSAQRCINLYADAARENSLSNVALFSLPGVTQFALVGTKPSRGAAVMDGIYYVVLGNILYSIDNLGVETSRGTITGTKRVSMANNGEKLCIVVPGGDGYQYNATTTTLTEITDPDYRTADTVCFKDGFYIFTATAGDVFFISALNDPLTFDPLDFGTAELAPDPIVACHVGYDELYVVGSESIEAFQNIGGADFPFQRIPGASFEKGTHSKYSLIQWEGSFYFAGGGENQRTSIFRTAAAAEPVSISTDAIDQEIQKFTLDEIGESFSFTYSINGFSFVGFTFRSINITSKTFVYNIIASKLLNRPIWLEQQSGISDNSWRANSVNFVYDKMLISDEIDGRIGILNSDIYTEYDNVILRSRTTSPFAADGRSIYVSELELTVDSGQGKISGQGENPKIMMDYSDDGARTWSSEFWKNFGKIGEYLHRVVWRRLGRIPAHRVWRFKVTDPVKVVFIKLEAEVTFGR